MNFLYNKQIPVILLALAFTGVACGQTAKVKTITIINGDTTISEKEIGDTDISDIEKHITMVINEDSDHVHNKTITKKIIINDEKNSDDDAFAYAYSTGENKDQDVEITTDENKNETKIIIKKGDGAKGGDDKKTVVRKSAPPTEDKKEKLNISINVKNTIAKVKIETSGKDPINVTVLDENGKQVFYDSAKEGGKYSKDINLEKKGTYFLNIIRNKKSTTEKIEIK
jgi:hypothetical protein